MQNKRLKTVKPTFFQKFKRFHKRTIMRDASYYTKHFTFLLHVFLSSSVVAKFIFSNPIQSQCLKKNNKKNQCSAPSSPSSMYPLHSEFCVDISFSLSVYSSFSISYLQKSLHVPDPFSNHRAVLHVIVDPASMASGRLCRLLVDDDLRTNTPFINNSSSLVITE